MMTVKLEEMNYVPVEAIVNSKNAAVKRYRIVF
jgi:hypothetical protein